MLGLLPLCLDVFSNQSMWRQNDSPTCEELTRFEDLNAGRLRSLTPDCQIQAPQFRREEARSCSLHSGNASEFFVLIGTLLFENRNGALASTDVNLLARLVVKDIIAIADSRLFRPIDYTVVGKSRFISM